MDGKTARSTIALIGLALVVGFFLPWIDMGWGLRVSGMDVVRHGSSGSLFYLMMLLVPIGGLAMVVTAIGGSKYVRLTSAATGLLLVGYGVVKTVHAFFATTGFGLWLVIAASCAALIEPFLARAER
ncbi:MAG: hypothetical protein ACXWP4_14280 [Polyangiales bacterium]